MAEEYNTLVFGGLWGLFLYLSSAQFQAGENLFSPIRRPHLESHVFVFFPLVLSKSVSWELHCLTPQSIRLREGAVYRVGRHVGKLRYTSLHMQKEHEERVSNTAIPVALTQGWLCLPREPWGTSGDIFGWYNWRKRVLLASSSQRPEMVLAIWQWQGPMT